MGALPRERAISDIRELFAKEAEPLGSVPPPATVRGIVTTAVKTVKGARPTQFIDKLGERLGFERTGVRLYEALVSKYNTYGSFTGGPTLAQLEENMLEEHSHFSLLNEVLTRLGADPTVMTPSADLHATMTKGILEVMAEPRTFVRAMPRSFAARRAGRQRLLGIVGGDGSTERRRHRGRVIRGRVGRGSRSPRPTRSTRPPASKMTTVSGGC